MTVLESLKLTTEFLQGKGISEARANAEIMLAHILKCKRLDLYLMFDKPLKPNEVDLYREFLKRRSKFEPLQHILGTVEFYGFEFKVNKNALIPRQETEILIETVLKNVDKENNLKILDIGTGTGNIPVSLAKNLPKAKFISIDINEKAIELAKENAKLNEVENQIEFLHYDIFSNQNFQKDFDVIVSNPPYVPEDEYKTLQKEILNFEPQNAVTDFNDGLTFYKLIAEKSSQILKSGGMIFFEIGKDQHEPVQKIIEKNFNEIKTAKDFLNIERVIYGVKN